MYVRTCVHTYIRIYVHTYIHINNYDIIIIYKQIQIIIFTSMDITSECLVGLIISIMSYMTLPMNHKRRNKSNSSIGAVERIRTAY